MPLAGFVSGGPPKLCTLPSGEENEEAEEEEEEEEDQEEEDEEEEPLLLLEDQEEAWAEPPPLLVLLEEADVEPPAGMGGFAEVSCGTDDAANLESASVVLLQSRVLHAG